MKLRPYGSEGPHCLPVSFEYITGRDRDNVIKHPRCRMTKTGVPWSVFVEVVTRLGFRTRSYYTDAAKKARLKVHGRRVLDKTLRDKIAMRPAIVATYFDYNGKPSPHAVAYIDVMQIDPRLGVNWPSSSRPIVGAIIFPGMNVADCAADIVRRSDAYRRAKK